MQHLTKHDTVPHNVEDQVCPATEGRNSTTSAVWKVFEIARAAVDEDPPELEWVWGGRCGASLEPCDDVGRRPEAIRAYPAVDGHAAVFVGTKAGNAGPGEWRKVTTGDAFYTTPRGRGLSRSAEKRILRGPPGPRGSWLPGGAY